jgi:hypothetical protein
MRILLSWSGERSQKVARSLNSWLPKVIQAASPWLSTTIPKGRRWQEELNSELSSTRVGIICLTKENLIEPWIHFEAGAIAMVHGSHVCTFLLDFPHEKITGPLEQFQHTLSQREDVLKLVETINGQLETVGERALSESQLGDSFDMRWPELESSINEIKRLPFETPSKPEVRRCLRIARSLLAERDRGFAEFFDKIGHDLLGNVEIMMEEPNLDSFLAALGCDITIEEDPRKVDAIVNQRHVERVFGSFHKCNGPTGFWAVFDRSKLMMNSRQKVIFDQKYSILVN